ncbi:MAG TPA: nitroreductase family protein, partial [Polyangium sp.]|nr:nitroreductase family protein [Polyangium sp.]
PDVLICIGARFGRVNWKYEGLAYAVILKDAGVLLELMDLTATALGLGACIVGRGHALDFLEATGNQAFEEESVGEFALGSLPEDDAHG